MNEAAATSILNIGYIGFNIGEVETYLNIDKKIINKLEKKSLLEVVGHYKVRAYGKDLYCRYYNINQVLDLSKLSEEKIKTKANFKEPTKAQLEGIIKANETRIKNRTCNICGTLYKSKKELAKGVCYNCLAIRDIISSRIYLFKNKEKYLILDTETTGLNYDDEVIEISLIDLDGKVIFNSLVKPSKKIPPNSSDIHNIYDEDVEEEETFDKVYKQFKKVIKDKTLIGFNIGFDIDKINYSISIYEEQESINNPAIDLMREEMILNDTDRYISLVNSLYVYIDEVNQKHRALSDCYLCLDLILKSIEYYEKYKTA